MQRKPWLMLAGVVVALVSLAFLVAACDDDEDEDGGQPPAATEPADEEPANGATDGGGSVDLSLAEFSVSPSVDTISAGSVTFNTSNDGAIVHNLRVIRTELDPDALPVDAGAFVVDEDQVEVVASSGTLEAGGTEEVVADLEPGSYVLICNIPTHYDAGMVVAFTVE